MEEQHIIKLRHQSTQSFHLLLISSRIKFCFATVKNRKVELFHNIGCETPNEGTTNSMASWFYGAKSYVSIECLLQGQRVSCAINQQEQAEFPKLQDTKSQKTPF
jgi:hypothetical protein